MCGTAYFTSTCPDTFPQALPLTTGCLVAGLNSVELASGNTQRKEGGQVEVQDREVDRETDDTGRRVGCGNEASFYLYLDVVEAHL